jgi:ATP-dependent protease ClpP protease subunit
MIRLYGEIGYEVVAADVVRQLEGFRGNAIEVHINSAGGDVFEGLAIYNALTQWNGQVHVTIDGLAASMASVIAMAGDTVTMASASLLMIHNPQTWVGGDQHKMQKTADLLETVRQVLVGAYTRKTGMTSEAVIELLDAETWMDAETAKRLGFVDEVIDSDLDIAACLRGFDLTKFKHIPEIAMSKETPAAPEAAVPEITNAVTAAPQQEVRMDTQKIAAEIDAARVTAVADERKRVAEVTKLCDRLHVQDMAQGFIESGATIQKVQEEILNRLAERDGAVRHAPPAGVPGEDNVDKMRAAASDWLQVRAGHTIDGKPVVVAGDNPFKGMRMVDMARECLERGGVSSRGLNQQQIVAQAISHSVSDFPNILQDAMHKTLLGAFGTAGNTWSRFCAVSDLSDFRPHYRNITGSFSDLATLGENGEIQDGTLDDSRKETITGSTKARILNLSHQAIVNDDMGVFTGAARALGRAAQRAVENDVYTLIGLASSFGPAMSDGDTLFHSNHGNVSTGAVSTANVAAAINVLKSQTLPKASTGVNEYIDLAMPPIFVGPLGLAMDARVVNENQYDDADSKFQKPNKSRGLLGDIVGTPRRTGLPWFLFANPSELPVIEVGFVQGQREPQLVMEESFRQYGVAWRVVYDYGVAAVNWLGCVRSTGA